MQRRSNRYEREKLTQSSRRAAKTGRRKCYSIYSLRSSLQNCRRLVKMTYITKKSILKKKFLNVKLKFFEKPTINTNKEGFSTNNSQKSQFSGFP